MHQNSTHLHELKKIFTTVHHQGIQGIPHSTKLFSPDWWYPVSYIHLQKYSTESQKI